MYKISVAKDFTQTPGARHKEDGPYPGDEFRENILIPKAGHINSESGYDTFEDIVNYLY